MMSASTPNSAARMTKAALAPSRLGPSDPGAGSGRCRAAPTEYQASSFPPELRQKLTVIHDGIDTERVKPNPDAELSCPTGASCMPRMRS